MGYQEKCAGMVVRWVEQSSPGWNAVNIAPAFYILLVYK